MGKTRKTVQKFRARPRSGKRSRLTDAKTIAVIERRYQVVALRRDGLTHREIAQELGISMATVTEDLKTILNDTIIKSAETAEENRQIQIDRLDRIIKSYSPLAFEWHKEKMRDRATGKDVVVECPPDPKYAQMILAAEKRRAELLALDKPQEKATQEVAVRIYEGVDISQV